jgi:Uma2 family endonuclease
MVIRSGVTIDEFLRMPETKPASELIWGEVVQKPMTKRSHWRTAQVIAELLGRYMASHGGDAGPEATVPLRATGNVFVPDMAYWAPEKPQGTNEEAMPATLAIEIRSEGQSMAFLRRKCRSYRESGVDVAWLIDPDHQTVEVFDGDLDGVPATGVLRSEHLPGFELDLDDLYRRVNR